MIGFDPAGIFQAEEGFDDAPTVLYSLASVVMPLGRGLQQLWSAELRFYGTLSAEQRAGLKDRKSLSFSSLSPAAKAQLQELAYHKHRSFFPSPTPDPNGRTRPRTALMQYMPEALPDGINPNFSLSLNISPQLGVLVQSEQVQGYSSLMSLDMTGLAKHTLSGQMPQLADYDRLRGRKAVGYIPGKHNSFYFEFQLSADMRASMYLESTEYNLRGKMVSLQELPTEYKVALQPPTTSPPPALVSKKVFVRRALGLEIRISLHEPNAGVPAEDGIVVASRPYRFRDLVEVHGPLQPLAGDVLRGVVLKQGSSPALIGDPGIVGAFVIRCERLGDRFAFRQACPALLAELVGNRKKQHARGRLACGFDGQDVSANAGCLVRLVKQPIPLAQLKRVRNSLYRNLLQLHYFLPVSTRNSFLIGS